MVVLCRSRLELQQHAISTKVGRKLKMLMKQHFRNGMTFYPGSFVIAAVALPGHSPFPGDRLNVAVALGGVGVGGGAEHGIGTGWETITAAGWRWPRVVYTLVLS